MIRRATYCQFLLHPYPSFQTVWIRWYPTEKPSITFQYLEDGTGNLAGIVYGILKSRLQTGEWFMDTWNPDGIKTDFQSPNSDGEKLYTVFFSFFVGRLLLHYRPCTCILFPTNSKLEGVTSVCDAVKQARNLCMDVESSSFHRMCFKLLSFAVWTFKA